MKWLIITLIMAIGIGTFGALYINGEKDKELNESRPSTYLTNQRKHDIDMKELAKITGEYQAVESGSPDSSDYVAGWWHLFISEDYDEQGPYLSVYDNSAGNPGFEGRIMYLQNDIVIVELDQDLFEQMPADWKTEGEGKYAILDYALTADGIRLGYRGSEADFVRASE
ncbi:MAG: hypothetical protein IJH90_07090 [Mogibacterium sp.]|nr:hypothetical protein [Mogibacterium sp.]